VPISEGALDLADLVMLRDVVTGEVTPPVDAPRVFKSTGMPWEDLAVAAAVTTRTPTPLPNATQTWPACAEPGVQSWVSVGSPRQPNRRRRSAPCLQRMLRTPATAETLGTPGTPPRSPCPARTACARSRGPRCSAAAPTSTPYPEAAE